MELESDITPFDACPALDGYHCQTNSLAKIFYHADHPLSEEMLLGLGAGMGFIYWKMKMPSGDPYVFIGGRGNTKAFFQDLGARTGVGIRSIATSSARKAQAALVMKLRRQEPVMLFGDMGFLPWFDLPEEYHFGGHTFVVCGYDWKDTVLASDIDQTASGLKPGFYYPLTLEQLARARGSTYKPFPPKHTALEFDFTHVHPPRSEEVLAAIQQMVTAQLQPPIKNLGVKGLRHTSREVLKWPNLFDDHTLRMNLFNLYIYIEIGGTGGGCFRYMYARFLQEAFALTNRSELLDAATLLHEAGTKFTEIGVRFKVVETMTNLPEAIESASLAFVELAELEERAYTLLDDISHV
jgi:hypothetical protein